MAPMFISHGSVYVLIFKHVLGDQCFLQTDKITKKVTLVVERKTHLVPREFEKTELYKQYPSWNGRFDNFATAAPFREYHNFQLPSDANVSEECIRRFDTQTISGWMVEFHFKVEQTTYDHLLPNASMWGLFEETTKPGKGCDEHFQFELTALRDTTFSQFTDEESDNESDQ